MGLAISIVATKNERVWYCTKKGYKPWFDPKPDDIRLMKDGGHTAVVRRAQTVKGD